MKGRHIVIGIVAWVVIVCGGYVLLQSPGPKHAASPQQPVIGPTQQTPLPSYDGQNQPGQSGGSLLPTNPGSGNGNGTTTAPGGGGATTPQAIVPPALQEAAEKQNLSAAGWSAVSYLPYHDKRISISYLAFNGQQAVITVEYKGQSQSRAEAALRKFLRAHHDSEARYLVRFVSTREASAAKAKESLMKLAFNGYPSLSQLPLSQGPVSIDFAGKHGRTVSIVLHGPKLLAKKAWLSLLSRYHDKASNYKLRYSR